MERDTKMETRKQTRKDTTSIDIPTLLERFDITKRYVRGNT